MRGEGVRGEDSRCSDKDNSLHTSMPDTHPTQTTHTHNMSAGLGRLLY